MKAMVVEKPAPIASFNLSFSRLPREESRFFFPSRPQHPLPVRTRNG